MSMAYEEYMRQLVVPKRQELTSAGFQELTTEEEVEHMQMLKHPKVVAKKSRMWFYAHTVVFGSALIYMWYGYGSNEYNWMYFVQNWDWFGDEYLPQPFTSELLLQVVRLWLIIYVVDSIINWSYTFFPNKAKENL